MVKYLPMEKMSVEQIQRKIEDEFLRWDDIYKNGSSDTCWEDGMGLDLTRNHIIFWYRLLDEKSGQPVQLSFFGVSEPLNGRRPLPPKVDIRYMANPTGLLKDAEKTLNVILNDNNYKFVLSLDGTLSANVRKKSCYDAVVRYADGLNALIEQKNYPRLRSYQNTEYWIKSYSEIRKRIEDAIAEEQKGQLIVLPDDEDDNYEEE